MKTNLAPYCTIYVALALMLVSVSAQAMDQKALDCAVTHASPELRVALTYLALEDTKLAEDLVAQQRELIDLCNDVHNFTPQQKSRYWEFAMTDIARLGIGPKLEEEGISPDVIDLTMGFGPGRSNPDYGGELSDDQLEMLVAGLNEEGVDVNDIDKATWSLIGSYIAVTGQSEQARIALE